MSIATFSLTGDESIPAKIYSNGHSSDVWIQSKWEDGPYAGFIRHNGCGHCCTSMALNLRGIRINPHEEFEACVKLWGEPVTEKPLEEAPFLSVSGIKKYLKVLA